MDHPYLFQNAAVILFRLIVYNILIGIYGWLVHLASFRRKKARQFVKGRLGWKDRLEEFSADGKPVIWVHCASLGEFEQGRPVIESLKLSFPEIKILLTFFSPSGYEIRKDYSKADAVWYLPLDTPSNARQFVSGLNLQLAIFVKYEVWPNYFAQLQKAEVELLMISAIFREDHRYFKWWGGFFRRALKRVSYFGVQTEHSGQLLESIGIKDWEVIGDTRFDRVLTIAENISSLAILEEFKGSEKLVVMGSTWPMDEKALALLLKQKSETFKIVIAPHEISSTRIQALLKQLGDQAYLYSEARFGDVKSRRCLIMDNMGILSRAYYHADVAVIGGGFGKGIHNTLEAAVYGIPLVFGPRYKRFDEAVQLIQCTAAISASTPAQMATSILGLLADDEDRIRRGVQAGNFVKSSAGATPKIVGWVTKKLGLEKNDGIGLEDKKEFN
jgi:3-deoxy-D-manno-octulosonic-acid transferase